MFERKPGTTSGTTMGNWYDMGDTLGTPNAINHHWSPCGLTCPVELSSFTAEFIDNKPTLYWQTETETDNLGWNVYRGGTDDFGQSIQINEEIIPGAGTISLPTHYEFADESKLQAGTTYWYWIESVSYDGHTEQFGPASLTIPENGGNSGTPTIPEKYGLFQNHPNPFNPRTTIRFKLEDNGQQIVPVSIKIFNINGELVETLIADKLYKVEETHTLLWNSEHIGSGVYFCRLETEYRNYVKKMIILK